MELYVKMSFISTFSRHSAAAFKRQLKTFLFDCAFNWHWSSVFNDMQLEPCKCKAASKRQTDGRTKRRVSSSVHPFVS